MKRFVPDREKFRSPLARRLIIAIVVASSTITLCLTAFQLYGDYRSELGSIQDDLRQIEEVHLKSLSQSLWATNEAELQLQIEGILRVPNLEYVVVREGDKVWAQAGHRVSRKIIERQYQMIYVYRGQTLDIGTMTIVASLDGVYRGLINRALIILASNAFKTFLVAGFAFAFFHWLVTRHLLSIVAHLRGLDLRGRASRLILARAADRQPDELDEVAAQLNRMLDTQQAAQRELQHKSEVARLLEQLARVANEAVSPEAAMEICLKRICEDGNWVLGRVATFSPGLPPRKPDRSQWFCTEPERFDAFMRYSNDYEFMSGRSVFINLVLRDQCPVWLPDLTALDTAKLGRFAMAVEAGLKAAFAFPVIVRGEVAAFLEFFATETRQPDALLIEGITGLAGQIARLIERQRSERVNTQLAAIVESSNDAILIRGLDRTILSWNAAAERLFGWTAQEAVGQSIDLIIPPERIGAMRPFIERAARGEELRPVENINLHKDGSRIPTQVTFSAIKDRQGNVVAYSVFARDITELKRNEDALRNYAARLRELSRRLREVEESERHAISRELHDRIGQGLTTLGLMVGVLDARLSTESRNAVQTLLKDMQALVQYAVAHVRDVMAELRPPVLDDYGLLAALRHLATEFANRTGIAVNLSGVDPYPRLPLIVETAMFRISQEALNNIAKHAYAKKIEISLNPASERVVLDIADDGVGFDTSNIADGGEHWGMITMRERAEAAGITFRLESAPGAGTRIVLEVKRAAS